MTRTVVRKAALPLTLLAAMFASSALAQTTPVPMPGWPVSVGAPIGAPQLAIADVNANGQLEIVVPTLAVGLVVYQADGSVLPGWAGGVGLTYNRVVVGNLVGDAKLELVAMRGGGGSQTRFDAYDSTGLALPGWPLTFQPMNSSPIIVSSNTSWALGDIDGDGYDEFVFLSEEEHRLAYAYDGDGSLVPGWPVSLVIPPTFPGDEFGLGGIAIADLEFDGVAEVLVTYEGELSGVGAVNGPLWVFDGDGAVRTGWPQAIAGVGPPFVVDLDRDYTPEIVQMGESWIRSVKPDGTVKFDGLLLGSVFILPVVGDLEGNGSREIVVPSWFDARVVEYGTLGIPPHFQIAATENAHANYRGPSLGDVDGDGDLEIAMWSQPDLNPQSDMILQLWHHDFTPVAGWPMTISPAVGTNFGNSTQMADLDGDGDAEIILGYHGSIHVPPPTDPDFSTADTDNLEEETEEETVAT
ncbi:MAG: VCBS repeat-containing protein, partial [Planctomycetota bacterium]